MEQNKYRRTELHCHTSMSAMAGVNDISDILKTVNTRGDIGALAVTDINSIQAFSNAYHYNKRKEKI